RARTQLPTVVDACTGIYELPANPRLEALTRTAHTTHDRQFLTGQSRGRGKARRQRTHLSGSSPPRRDAPTCAVERSVRSNTCRASDRARRTHIVRSGGSG